jgi:hypothetical protein
MRWIRTLLCFSLLLALPLSATPCKIAKVLPQLLDDQGRHSVSPSLYGRDAYQAYLRANPEKCSGMRFAIQWKARIKDSGKLNLRVEARVSKEAAPLNLEATVKRTGWLDRWTYIPLTGERFQKAGEVTAWRVTLWDGNVLLAEQKSFLW